MLKIDWGLHDDTVIFVDDEFDGTGHSMEWFRDPFVQEMIRDIDNCIYDSDTEICIDLNVPENKFKVDDLSTGSKLLVLLYKWDYDEIRVYGSLFGDNCTSWLLKIAKSKNIIIDLKHFLHFPEEEFEAFSIYANRKYFDYRDYCNEVLTTGFLSWAGRE